MIKINEKLDPTDSGVIGCGIAHSKTLLGTGVGLHRRLTGGWPPRHGCTHTSGDLIRVGAPMPVCMRKMRVGS